jgi:hypothetical protein
MRRELIGGFGCGGAGFIGCLWDASIICETRRYKARLLDDCP